MTSLSPDQIEERWLIEDPAKAKARWFSRDGYWLDWLTDLDEAMTFLSKADAEKYIRTCRLPIFASQVRATRADRIGTPVPEPTPGEIRPVASLDGEIAALKALAEKATPGPWRSIPIRGYTDDLVVTDHPDYQQKPHGNYVAETGLAAGHQRQNFQADSAFIAAADPSLILRLITEREQDRAQIADYEEVLADKRRLAREIDTAMHGEDGAAKQPSLCDLVQPAKWLRERADAADKRVAELEEALKPFSEGGYGFHSSNTQIPGTSFTVGDLRRARSVLQGGEHG